MRPTMQQMIDFWRKIEERKITRKNLQIFLEFFGEPPIFKVTITEKVVQNLIEMGNYDSGTDRFTYRSELDESQLGDFELVLYHPERDGQYSIKRQNVISEMAEQNLEPAKIGHILALGAKYPELQRSFIIVAIGYLYIDEDDGSKLVPCISERDGNRTFHLAYGSAFDERWHFLAVRK
ncbi:hypothetical protein ACFL2B_02140 [Patescibacteria group bacterium]